MKKIFKNLKNSIYKYASTNILFLSFVVISLLISFIMRLFTIGTPIIFKSFLGDLFVILVVGSFGYFFKPIYQFKYFLSWLIFFTLLTIANTIYYQFYQSFLSINLIATATMANHVKDAVFDKINIFQFFYSFGTIIFILIHIKLSKSKYYYEVEKTEDGKKMFIYSIGCALFIIVSLAFMLPAGDASKIKNQWNREYIVQRYGLYIYHVNDIIQSLQPRINTTFGYDESALKFREYYSCKFNNKKEINEYTNIFEGKNVLFIHAESIQNFLVDLKINDVYVTPNLNRLAKEGIYFNKFYPQISVGTSSDTEFTLSTGLMPSSSGTVFVNYYDRKYYALPQYFNNLGYYTFSAHANHAEFWNRKKMYNTLGYQDFYARDSFIVPDDYSDPEIIGLGLSDKSFFKQLVPIIKNIKDTRSPFMGTIITLSNHSPFDDITKFENFDVSMDYEYIDENGKNKIDNANYLKGTRMGNYIISSHYADEALGELIELLDKENILENTIVIIYGDHEARLPQSEFVRLYNYDPITDDVKFKENPTYISMDNYKYDLLKNTPFIIWSKDTKYEKTISSTMGMYDVLPTVANMFGFNEKYSLGNDIFSSNEKIVVFPNGNILTDKIYYNNLKDEYIAFEDTIITSDYIDNLTKYADEILELSNGIIFHNLIQNEENKIGECKVEKK